MNFSETTIVDATMCALGCLSVLTWSVILLKAGEILFNRYRNQKVIRHYQSTLINLNDALQHENQGSKKSQAGRLLMAGQQVYQRAYQHNHVHLANHEAWHELIERTLLQQLQNERAYLDTGLGWLATIGSTSPFVGLFGTVWGIMHALKDISIQGNASLEVVAGPIGEALIATAMGLAVAIPAVVAYNFFLRQNKGMMAQLEHLAGDFLRGCIENDLTKNQAVRNP